jgi:hypothetical protein
VKLGLYGKELVATGGNRFKAVNSREWEFHSGEIAGLQGMRLQVHEGRNTALPGACGGKSIVKYLFGTIKCGMDAGYCLTRGLCTVTGKFSLTFPACNLKRVINIPDCQKLMECLAGQVPRRPGITGGYIDFGNNPSFPNDLRDRVLTRSALGRRGAVPSGWCLSPPSGACPPTRGACPPGRSPALPLRRLGKSRKN